MTGIEGEHPITRAVEEWIAAHDGNLPPVGTLIPFWRGWLECEGLEDDGSVMFVYRTEGGRRRA